MLLVLFDHDGTDHVLPPDSPEGLARDMYNAAVDTPSGMSKAAFLRAFLKVCWSVTVYPVAAVS